MNKPHFLALAAGTLLCTWLGAGSAYAHGDEDHSSPAPAGAAAPSSWLPRASATTEAFEIVAVLEAQPPRLVIHLDRAGSNDPVGKATLEVEGAGPTAKAVEVAFGVYALNLAQPLTPGAHALNFTVQSADGADLIAATLDVPSVEPSAITTTPAQIGRPTGTDMWLGGSALLAAGGGLAFLRLRRRHGVTPSPTQQREPS